ncbi:MAG: two-component regulator propeller domain-containing protein, partial [Limisphaerales bacterium]
MRHNNHDAAFGKWSCRYGWVVVLLCLFLISSLQATAGDYLHKIWRAEDGLPNPVIRAVKQCTTGYLWLGTDEGLVRFDGVQFRSFEQKQSSERIERWLVGLTETEDGSIWCSSANRGLIRVRDGKTERYGTAQGLPRDYVLTLLEDSRKTLWAGTAGGLAKFDGEKFVPYTNQPGLIVEAVRALAEDRSGKLWIGTATGLSSFDGKRFESFTSENLLVNNSIMALCADSKGVLWVGTGAGLTRVQNGQPTHFTMADGLVHNVIRAIYEDRSGQVWIGTQGGLQKVTDGGFETVPLRNTSEDFEGITFVYTIFEDREGNLWVGTTLGLNRLQPARFRSFSREEGLPHTVATLVFEMNPGELWVGTYGGGLAILRENTVQETWSAQDGGLTSNFILALHKGRDGTLWIGTDGTGMNRYKDGVFTQFLGHDLPANTVRVIFEDSRKNIWVGHNLGVSRLENDVLVYDPTLPKTIAKAIIEDRRGDIWVASRGGLARWVDGNVTTYKYNGLLSERINAVYEDADGIFWIGTEAGLN